MKNPFKIIKSKAVDFKNSRFAKASAVTLSSTVAGTAASVLVGTVLARAPLYVGVKIGVQFISYVVASTFTHEIMDEIVDPSVKPVDYSKLEVKQPVVAQNDEV